MRLILALLVSLAPFAHAAERPVVRTVNDQNLKWGPCPAIFPAGCQIGVLHGDPAKKGTDVYLKVPGNYAIPPHSHTSAEHMTLVSGNLTVRYQGADPMTLNQGSYAFGPAGLPHEAKCAGPNACVLFISFDEPIDAKAFEGKL